MKEELNPIALEESQLIDILSNDLMDEFRDEFMQLHPYDQSLFFEKVEPEIRKKIYHYLSPKEYTSYSVFSICSFGFLQTVFNLLI